jgi:hypothetical protein
MQEIWTQVKPKEKKQRKSIVEVLEKDEKATESVVVYSPISFKNFIEKGKKKNKVQIKKVKAHTYKVEGEFIQNVFSAIWDLQTESMKQIKNAGSSNSREVTGHWDGCHLFFNQENFMFQQYDGKDNCDYYFTLQKDSEKPLKQFEMNYKGLKKESTQNNFSIFKGIPNFTEIVKDLQTLDEYDLKLAVGNLLFYNKNYDKDTFIDHKTNFDYIKKIGVLNDKILRTAHVSLVSLENIENLRKHFKEQNYKSTKTKDIYYKLYSKCEHFQNELYSKEKFSHIKKYHMYSYNFVDEKYDIFLSSTRRISKETKFKDFETINKMLVNMESVNQDIVLPGGYFIDEIPTGYKDCTIITEICFYEDEVYEIDGVTAIISESESRKTYKINGRDDKEYSVYIKSKKDLKKLKNQELEDELKKLFTFTYELKRKFE